MHSFTYSLGMCLCVCARTFTCVFNFYFFLVFSMNPLPMHDFVTSSIGHLGIIDSLSFAKLPNVDTFHYTISKNINSLISTLIA